MRILLPRITLEKHLAESSRGSIPILWFAGGGRQKRRKKLRTTRVGGSHVALCLLPPLRTVRQRARFFPPPSRFSRNISTFVRGFHVRVGRLWSFFLLNLRREEDLCILYSKCETRREILSVLFYFTAFCQSYFQ